MNGIHDLGGMDGFGPVVCEKKEPIFHQAWERRVFGMLLATLGQGLYNIDELRHAIERMSPAHYLGSPYYEHWLAGLQRLLVEKGRASAAEIETKVREFASAAPPAVPKRSDTALAQGLAQAIHKGAPASRGKGHARFASGAHVRVRRMNPHGHTRCPRYVRGVMGTIEHVHERFVFPDANAHGGGESPQVLYTVGFEAADLWGADAEGKGKVYVDLWQSYLEPAARTPKRAQRSSSATRRRRAAKRAPRRQR
jgi:nitrile hydratase subunit beta